MTTPRLILFDCDGTLVDSAATILAAFNDAFGHSGEALPQPAEILSVVGLSLPVAAAELCRGRGVDTAAFVDTYKASYATIVSERVDPLFPGTGAMLDDVDTETTLMGIVTGKSRRGLTRILDEHDLARRFVTTHTADDAASKPAPDMVHQALRATGADPARTVVIGDTSFDIEMALAAGVHAIAVTWGNHDEAHLSRFHPHATAREMAELPTLIDRLTPP